MVCHRREDWALNEVAKAEILKSRTQELYDSAMWALGQ